VRRLQLAVLDETAGGVAGAVRALVEEVRVEIAVGAEELEHLLGVDAVEGHVHAAVDGGLGHELAHEAAHVGVVLALTDRLAVVHGGGLHVRVAVLVDEGLELDAEFAAVADEQGVVLRDPRRAAVEVEMRFVVEGADLAVADLVDDVAVAHGQVAAAGAVTGLDDGVVVAGLLEFPGGREARDARAEDQHVTLLLAEAADLGGGGRGRCGDEAEGGGGAEHGARASGHAHRFEEGASGDDRHR